LRATIVGSGAVQCGVGPANSVRLTPSAFSLAALVSKMRMNCQRSWAMTTTSGRALAIAASASALKALQCA